MTARDREQADLRDAIVQWCERRLPDKDSQRLMRTLAGDADARRLFAEYNALVALLELEIPTLLSEQELPDAAPATRASRAELEDSEACDRWSNADDSPLPNQQSLNLAPPSVAAFNPQPIVLDLSRPLAASPATFSAFIESPVFPYMVASVFVCLLLLGFWAHKIPHDRNSSIADSNSNSRGLTDLGESFHARPVPVFVGRITGMAGVKWSADPDFFPPFSYASVSLGRKYKLDSGLLEITYDSGAKVILEGPCDYEVDSTAGGYLALGKLVAKVGPGGEGRGAGEVAGGQRPAASGQGSGSASLATSHSPLATNSNPQPPIPNPLFSVRTPTAVVTDLGTEFGVEVAANGDTISHVFQGAVVVQAGIWGLGDSGMRDSDKRPATAIAGGESEQSVTLAAGESVHVGRMRATHQEATEKEMVRFTHPTTPPKFVRRIYEPPKTLDLLDIVAGGNGVGKRRERGIDAASGMEDPIYVPEFRGGDGRYKQVGWHSLIDGVFVPGGGKGAVQLDSAGHQYEGFPDTSGTAWGSIWARAAEIRQPKLATDTTFWIYAVGPGEQFMPDGRGLLCMHANAGITFDLDAVRRWHDDCQIERFRAVAANLRHVTGLNSTTRASADIWVFIDGQKRFEKRAVNALDGKLPIDIPLTDNNRFLTLVSTDAGNDIHADWVVFGDPVLEMKVKE